MGSLRGDIWMLRITAVFGQAEMTAPHDPVELHRQLQEGFAGRFTVGSPCGSGAQSTVFRARRLIAQDNSPADDDVAIKLYSNDAMDERVRREIDALRRVRHPCLANMIEAGEVQVGVNRAHYIAFTFVPGSTLAGRLKAQGALPEPAVVAVGRDVATAINELWNSPGRIVHRDVKPANIMLRVGEREAVLLDLGVSRFSGKTPITTAGVTFGTMGYMSLEQISAESLTSLSDVFSLGIVIVEAYIGRHPTDGRQSDILRPLNVKALMAGAEARLAALVHDMLDQDPSGRPTPAEVRDELSALL